MSPVGPKEFQDFRELAKRLLNELAFTPHVALCLACAARRLDVDRWDVMKAIRDLITSGSILCLFTLCWDCGESELVARARQQG